MSPLSIFVLIAALAIAVLFHLLNIQKMKEVQEKTRGIIKTRQDLLLVKETINLSMRLAFIYIGLFILLIVYVVIMFIKGTPGQGIAILFVFGITTLPLGLWGKGCEKKVKSMHVQSDDPEINNAYQRYLKEWNEPRFQLPD